MLSEGFDCDPFEQLRALKLVTPTRTGWGSWGCLVQRRGSREMLLLFTNARWGSASYPRQLMMWQEDIALSCARGGSNWTSGRTFSVKGCWSIGRGWPGWWWSHRPWWLSGNDWMYQLVPWYSWQGGHQSEVGLNDLGGLFQPVSEFKGQTFLENKFHTAWKLGVSDYILYIDIL